MTIELITGTAGTNHVDSADVGAFNAATIGSGSYLLSGGACTMVNSNTANIAAAELLLQGRHVRITGGGEDATIDNGEVGMNRNDLVCAHYIKSSGIESVSIGVLKGTPAAGTPADPTVPSGSIIAGANEAWVPLYRIPIIELEVQTPVRVISQVPTLPLIDRVIDIAHGGTGKSNAKDAASALGAFRASNGSLDDVTWETLFALSGTNPGAYLVNRNAAGSPAASSYGNLMLSRSYSNRMTAVIAMDDGSCYVMRGFNTNHSWVRIDTMDTLSVARGGTGASTAAGARNALGLGNTTGALPIANGGTGASTVAAARNALGLGNTAGALPVANGGTGSTTAAAARAALHVGCKVKMLEGYASCAERKTITLSSISADYTGVHLAVGNVSRVGGGTLDQIFNVSLLSPDEVTKALVRCNSLSGGGVTTAYLFVLNAGQSVTLKLYPAEGNNELYRYQFALVYLGDVLT